MATLNKKSSYTRGLHGWSILGGGSVHWSPVLRTYVASHEGLRREGATPQAAADSLQVALTEAGY